MVDFSSLPDLPEKGLQAALIYKMFGPPAGAIGDRLKASVEHFRLSNLGHILRIAAAKLGPNMDVEGSAPLRMFAETWDRGTFSDDELMAEYFGGILASSRTPDGGNDRGVSWAGLVGRLATDDVRWHYLLYQRWRTLSLHLHEDDQAPNLGENIVLHGRLRMYAPLSGVASALGTDPASAWDIAVDATYALAREGLIWDQWEAYGDPDKMRETAPEADGPGFILSPSVAGVQLFSWAHGNGAAGVNALHSPDVSYDPVAELPSLGDGARLCSEMKRPPAQ